MVEVVNEYEHQSQIFQSQHLRLQWKDFVVNRGKTVGFFCDCATNIKDGNKEFIQLYNFVSSVGKDQLIQNYFAKESIDWKFNIPSALHFGEL